MGQILIVKSGEAGYRRMIQRFHVRGDYNCIWGGFTHLDGLRRIHDDRVAIGEFGTAGMGDHI